MIIGIQVIALLFAFCMIYFSVLHFKRRELSGSEIVSWIIMWTLAIVVIVFPELLQPFAKTFLVTRVFDLMTIAGFILVISMVSVTYVRTKKLEKKLEDMVRREALKGKKKNK
ncbi:MAG: DUF2304 domain-containing protein [Candidatus Microgenomates bacterium]|jgi:hypothetical protein